MPNEIVFKINLFVFDFDGFFTNNKVIVSEDGKESVIFDGSDRPGLKIQCDNNIHSIILSTKKIPLRISELKKLGINCIHGSENKLNDLKIITCEIGFV